MPMTQDDIRRHYEVEWKQKHEAATDVAGLAYADPVGDVVTTERYRGLLRDYGIRASGRVLDAGAGSGRWVRYFLEEHAPERLLAVDFAQASVDLLQDWMPIEPGRIDCRRMDLTSEAFDLDERFDLINVQNVLYHIPELPLYRRALRNLASVLADDGCIVVNEFMPHLAMRTEWMQVRSRHEIEREVADAGLRIAGIVPCRFINEISMGVDGLEGGVRTQLQSVAARMRGVVQSPMNPEMVQFFETLFADLDRAVLDWAAERVAAVDMPAGKFLVLRRA